MSKKEHCIGLDNINQANGKIIEHDNVFCDTKLEFETLWTIPVGMGYQYANEATFITN